MRFNPDGKYAVYARQDLIGDISDRAVVRIVNDKPAARPSVAVVCEA